MIGDFLEVRTPDGFTFWDFEKKLSNPNFARPEMM